MIHSENSELVKTRNISVKHAIYVTMLRHTDASIYINFTSGKNNLEKTVKQILEVKNEFRELNVTVFIRVPVKLGAENIWTNKNLQVKVCANHTNQGETNKYHRPILAADTTEGNKLTKSTCRKRRKGKPHAEQAQVPGPVVREAPDLSAPNPEVLEDLTLVPSPSCHAFRDSFRPSCHVARGLLSVSASEDDVSEPVKLAPVILDLVRPASVTSKMARVAAIQSVPVNSKPESTSVIPKSTPESIVPESTIEESSSRAHSKESSPVPAVEVIVFEPAPERAVPVSAPTPEFAPVSAEKDSKSVSESDPATLKDTLEPVSNPVSKTLSVSSSTSPVSVTVTKPSWKSRPIPDCFRERDEWPTSTAFLKVLEKTNILNCSVAVCAVFRCDVNLMRNERKFYKISGNVSSGWIEQIGIRSASFQLVSTASLDYDEDKYIYFADSLSSVPVCELNTQVEVYEEPSILKEVIVGVIGGLMIISLITAVLYKSGFFKRKAKQQIKDPAQEADEVKMDQNFYIILCILCVSHSVMAFNIDPSTWKTFTSPQNVSFGYKVIQKDTSSLIVSDPLIQINQAQRGQIYSCFVTEGTCSPQNIIVPLEAVNMSLGLSMVQDPRSSKLAICGPTISKKCVTVTTYNGMCFISENNVLKPPIPSVLRDCPDQIDIAFLLDGSGSVGTSNFVTMKTFVVNMIKRFTERDGQFAIAQYSHNCEIHYNFNNLKIQDSTWESKVKAIPYNGGATYTARAILKLVNELFTSAGGARPSAKKILVVITDGVSHDRGSLSYVASQAEAKNIARFAIGVGNAFNDFNAKEELKTIASDPDTDHVFKVTDFNALNNILQKLEENIIAIEGTQSSGDSSRMEFAQDGFSTAFTAYKSVLVSAVGAFQWKGGYQEYFPNSSFRRGIEHESYLGYSMAVATVSSTNYVILGAPRYKHQGQVLVSQATQYKLLDSPRPQIGSYFGADVCVVDLNSDSDTDLLLISSPTYMHPDREGKVFVYIFTTSPADLDGDGFRDVLIGAPLEEDGQGSIYIFNGGVDQINPTYSQRIGGSSVQSGLRFFGISLSQSSLDQSGDRLPDIAVGSMGAVQLLRSRPIMFLNTQVSYNPSKIPTSVTDCTKPLQNFLTVCFTMSGYKQSLTDLAANINYTITLDAKRQKYRAYFPTKNRLLSDVMYIELQEVCKSHAFFIERFPSSVLSSSKIYKPRSIRIADAENSILASCSSRTQLPIALLSVPAARLSEPGTTSLTEPRLAFNGHLIPKVNFEINCGTDNLCVDDLRMDFNFSGSANIEVGIMQEINVTVFVENRGENSYNTRFILNYPFGLSYRRITYKQVVFEITFSINKESTLGRNVTFKAEVSSGNDKHSSSRDILKEKAIGVKYAIYTALIRHENSTIHINFTSGKKDLMKPVQQIIKIENDLRELNFKVFIRVPVKVGNADIWTNSSLQISGCKEENIQKPVITNFIDIIKSQHIVNCSVAACVEFSCDVTLLKNERILYNITGNVSSGWIEQTGLRAAVFQLVSSASLDYDKSKYVFFSSDSQETAPSVQINTQVEVYEEVDLTKEIIGGVIGGLLLLALITAALYKAGFFKSQYKQMLEEAKGDAGGQPNMPQ
ncbi:Integrin alpha-X [Labeo rohita]|uniref:Integrin alpha-X n=1 Tax=Labeo rohita TaxID=84645 RepID=A0ABQ8MAM8_LABRO|nr:Integrin alpha-X [Labeo rohita]